SRIHSIPLLLLVVIAASLAIFGWLLGFAWLATDIAPGGTYLTKSIAGLAKDALFVPLKPLMYALIILSIGSSLAISTGGLGAKFSRVLGFFVGFSLLGILAATTAFLLFRGVDIGLADPSSSAGTGDVTEIPFLKKIYGVLTSALMISIYAGLLFGAALKRLDLGHQADQISDLFIKGFRKFLQYTIPLAVFGSITLALNSEDNFSQLTNLFKLVVPYVAAMGFIWVIMIVVTAYVQKRGIGFVLRAVLPQALVALSTSSSIATLTATREACSQLGANADEATPFYTIGATINMVGTLIGLMLLSLYTMQAFGLDVSLLDMLTVGLQSLIYATAAAG
ncbi:MAG: cation:dicarboxylase symporter family transporter, partial [Lentilitoribacter sp.]